MPTRLIRDGILTSDTICQLKWPEEVFYHRLLLVADDYGLYDARASILRARLYPNQLDLVSNRDIEKWHQVCVQLGLVKVYESDGHAYGQIAKYGQQYKSIPKFPLPPWADPNEYRPKPRKKKQSAKVRNASLRSAAKRHLDEDEDEYKDKSLLSESFTESHTAAVEPPPPPSDAIPASENEVAWFLRNTPGLMLTEAEIVKCACCFYNDFAARNWRDAKGFPVYKWEPAARGYAFRWQTLANTAPASGRRSTSSPTSTRQGCNDPSDYR